MVDSAFLEWDKAGMLTSLQQADVRNKSTAFQACVTKRTVLLNANYALLLGLLIIPSLSGVVLIA